MLKALCEPNTLLASRGLSASCQFEDVGVPRHLRLVPLSSGPAPPPHQPGAQNAGDPTSQVLCFCCLRSGFSSFSFSNYKGARDDRKICRMATTPSPLPTTCAVTAAMLHSRVCVISASCLGLCFMYILIYSVVSYLYYANAYV